MSDVAENAGQEPDRGMESLKAQNFFWAMFRVRLVLLALILPIVIMIVDEVVSAFLQNRTLYLTGMFLQLGLRLIIMLLGLCLVIKFLTGSPSGLLFWPFKWTVLPLLGLFRDLYQLPRIWIARLIEAFACRGTSGRKWPLSPGTAVMEIIVFTAVLAGSYATCHPLYHEWAERNRSLKAQNDQRTELNRSKIDPSQIEKYEHTRDMHKTEFAANETVEDIFWILQRYREYLQEELHSKPLKQKIFEAITTAEEALKGRARDERLQYYWYMDWCEDYFKSLDDIAE